MVLHLLFLLIPNLPCFTLDSNLGEFDFAVTISSAGPLGVRLDNNLQVIGFVQQNNTKFELEAGGFVARSHRLISVNNRLLVGMNLSSAATVLKLASVPKLLLFRPRTLILLLRPWQRTTSAKKRS